MKDSNFFVREVPENPITFLGLQPSTWPFHDTAHLQEPWNSTRVVGSAPMPPESARLINNTQ